MTRAPAPVWVGVDVGGTKVGAAVVEEDRVVRQTHRATPGARGAETDLEDLVVEVVAAVADGAPLAGVGVAAAGFVDGTGELVRFAPHLPWRDAPVRARLEERLGARVVLDNDATAATFAEWTLGAGRGADSMVMVTVGTGIGGGVVTGGRLVRGHQGMAGEFGHVRLVPEGLPCECGGRGCWEQYCSGRALARAVREHWDAASDLLTGPCGGEAERVTGSVVAGAARAGDPVARQAFVTVGGWLGRGLAALVAVLDPEVVVVGGGVSANGDLLLGPARDVLRESVVGAGHREVPPVVAAALGPYAGVVGAAGLARRGPG